MKIIHEPQIQIVSIHETTWNTDIDYLISLDKIYNTINQVQNITQAGYVKFISQKLCHSATYTLCLE